MSTVASIWWIVLFAARWSSEQAQQTRRNSVKTVKLHETTCIRAEQLQPYAVQPYAVQQLHRTYTLIKMHHAPYGIEGPSSDNYCLSRILGGSIPLSTAMLQKSAVDHSGPFSSATEGKRRCGTTCIREAFCTRKMPEQETEIRRFSRCEKPLSLL